MSLAPSSAFWREKNLDQMTQGEWESLCDGCGKCCLHKIRERNGTLTPTNVACRLLDTTSCRCGNYARRKALVPDCVVLTPASLKTIDWLPQTCAYRLLKEGKDLADWHPLISGDAMSVHIAGVSMQGRCISERDAGPLHEHATSSIL